MQTMSNHHKQASDKDKPSDEKREQEDQLDEAIADSMIASDPPASVSKGKPTAPPRKNPAVPGEKRTETPNPE
jgi:hypothetical protein